MDNIKTDSANETVEITLPHPRTLLRKSLVIVGAAAGLFVGIGAYEHLRNKHREEGREEVLDLITEIDSIESPTT